MTEISVGDRVRDQYGEVGTIVRQWDDFSAIRLSDLSANADGWLAEQNRPFSCEELQEPWYSVAIEPRGEIWSPQSRLTPMPANG